jgi:hypothetical protein
MPFNIILILKLVQDGKMQEIIESRQSKFVYQSLISIFLLAEE